MADILVQPVTSQEAGIVFDDIAITADPANRYYFLNLGQEKVLVRGISGTASIGALYSTPFTMKKAGLTIEAIARIWIVNGVEIWVFGPFSTSLYNDASENVYLTFSAAAQFLVSAEI